jgi:hypothetical protein
MWLSKPVYEGLPFYYMGLGLASLTASFYIEFWYWPRICALAGLTLLVGGLVLWLKRRDYRSSRSRTRFDETL